VSSYPYTIVCRVRVITTGIQH